MKQLMKHSSMRPGISKYILLLLTCFLLLENNLFAEKITVEIKPKEPVVGASVSIKIISDTASDIQLEEGYPEVEGIQWQKYVGHETGISIINGKINSTYTLVGSFRVTKEGEITIPPIQITSNGKRTETPSVTFTAQNLSRRTATRNAAGGRGATPTMFCEITVPGKKEDEKLTYFVGEEIPIEFTVFLRSVYTIHFNDYPEIKDKNGAMLRFHDFGTRNKENSNFDRIIQDQQVIGNAGYRTYTFQTKVIATKPGELNLQASIPSQIIGRDSDDIGFFSFERVLAEQVFQDELKSISIVSLPTEPAETPYIGVMTGKTPTVSISQEPYTVGEPITLKIKFEERIQPEAIKIPKLNAEHFRVYQPETEHVNGETEIRYTLIPLEQGKQKISLAFSVFNLGEKEYRPIRFQKEIEVAQPVGQIKTATGPSIVTGTPDFVEESSNNEPKKQKRETMLYLHDNLNNKVTLPLYYNHLLSYIVMFGLGLLSFMTCLCIWIHQKKINSNQTLQRRLKAKSVRNALYKEIAICPASELSERCSGELCVYLNNMLDLPEGTPLSVIADKVRDGQSAELAEQLKQLSDISWMPSMKHTISPDFNQKLLKNLKRFFIILLSICSFEMATYGQTAQTNDSSFGNPVAEANVGKLANNAEAAKNLYDTGDFQSALAFYASQIKDSEPSPALLYNMGNCYCQLGDNAKAIVCYERALALAPRDSDIIENLNLARRKLMLPAKYQMESPADFFQNFYRMLRVDEWGVVIAFSVMLLLLLEGLKLVIHKKFLNSIMVAGLILFGISMICFGFKFYDMSLSSQTAVVTAPNAAMYSLPSDQSGHVERYVKPGSEIKIEETRLDWSRIRFDNGDEGWMKTGELAPLQSQNHSSLSL